MVAFILCVLVVIYACVFLIRLCGTMGIFLVGGILGFLIAIITGDGGLGLLSFVLVNVWLWGTSYIQANNPRDVYRENKKKQEQRDYEEKWGHIDFFDK